MLLFSGGIDSVLAACVLRDQGMRVLGLTVDFPGRPRQELEAAARLAKQIPLERLLHVNLEYAPESGLPLAQPAKLPGWIPYRNTLFWILAAQHATSLSTSIVASGTHEDDAVTFTDARSEYLEHLNSTMFESGLSGCPGPKMLLPLYGVSDGDYWALMARYRSMMLETWSCWIDQPSHCGECDSCHDRTERMLEMERALSASRDEGSRE